MSQFLATNEKEITAWDIKTAQVMSPQIEEAIIELFKVREIGLQDDQRQRLMVASTELSEAYRAIVAAIPPGDDRTSALKNIRDAFNDCTNAVIHRGNF